MNLYEFQERHQMKICVSPSRIIQDYFSQDHFGNEYRIDFKKGNQQFSINFFTKKEKVVDPVDVLERMGVLGLQHTEIREGGFCLKQSKSSLDLLGLYNLYLMINKEGYQELLDIVGRIYGTELS